MDQVKRRRSRMSRTRTGKRVALTPRDIHILTVLQQYRYLRSTYLHAFTGGASATRFKERLAALYHEAGYIDRPAQQWDMPDARCQPAVYEISGRGQRVLESLRQETGHHPQMGRIAASGHFQHALTVCEILASIELGTRRGSGLRFVAWPEILHKTPLATRQSPRPAEFSIPNATTLIPDGIFGLEYERNSRKTYRFFAMEFDRGTMPAKRADIRQSSFVRKARGYRSVIQRELYRGQLGVPNLLVLNVMPNQRHMATVMRAIETELGTSKTMLFKVLHCERTPNTSLLDEPWLRIGHSSFNIDTPSNSNVAASHDHADRERHHLA